MSKTRKTDLALRLAKHFIGSPGEIWSANEIMILLRVNRPTLYRNLKKVVATGIAARIGTGYTLNPEILGSVRGNTTQLKKIKEKIDARSNAANTASAQV